MLSPYLYTYTQHSPPAPWECPMPPTWGENAAFTPLLSYSFCVLSKPLCLSGPAQAPNLPVSMMLDTISTGSQQA